MAHVDKGGMSVEGFQPEIQGAWVLVTTSNLRLKQAWAWCGDLCWDQPISPYQRCSVHFLYEYPSETAKSNYMCSEAYWRECGMGWSHHTSRSKSQQWSAIRYANGVHLSAIWENTAPVQWIRCGPLGKHFIHWTCAIFSHIARKLNDVCIFSHDQVTLLTWLPYNAAQIRPTARERYGLIPICVS